jgi:DNA repair exonuclease SbcCD nuclease subunit
LRFLHAADVHLDSPLRGLERYEGAPVEEIRGATRRAFENLVALAIEESVDFVLLAGDIYDGDWRDYNTGLFFSGQMGRLNDHGIPVFLIAGNHDAASQITKALRAPPNLSVFATRAPETWVLEHLGVAIHGQGFPSRAVTDDLSRAYPQGDPALFNIGLLHTSLDGRPGHEPYAPCTADGLRAKGYQYWALGHVHQRELIAEDPYILYPGNIQGRHIRETGPKGCTLVRVEEGEVVEIEPRSLDVVRWAVCPVDVTDVRSLDQILPLVEHALAEASDGAEGRLLATRLRLTGRSPIHSRLHADHERLVNECRALVFSAGIPDVWIEKLVVETHPSAPVSELSREDAFGGLLRTIHALELDGERLSALSEEVELLALKLPPVLRGGDDPFDPSDPEYLAGCLEDVKALLVERLRGQGDPQEGAG